MKIIIRTALFLLTFLHSHIPSFSQNVGLGTATPQARLHIKGEFNTSELTIDADTNQSNTNPMIRLRKSDGTDLVWLHSDNTLNLFIGNNAGRVNLPASGFNTFIGSQAGYSNTSGTNNSAIGSLALYSNTIQSFNTAVGAGCLYSNNTGFDNTAIGAQTLFSNTGGAANTSLGSQALYSNTSGTGSTAIGYNALRNVNVGERNTAVGYQSGVNMTNGFDNTLIGTYTDAPGSGFSNSTCLGAGTGFSGSNQVRIGNSVTSIGGPQNWTNFSDARIKTNVKSNVPGLVFIKLLHPVTYNKSIHLENEIMALVHERGLSPDNPYEKIRYSGFIAQDVEAAARSIGYEFSGVDAPQNDKSLYGLRYAEFVVPLVKAVQELSEKLISENEKLSQRIEQLEKILEGKH